MKKKNSTFEFLNLYDFNNQELKRIFSKKNKTLHRKLIVCYLFLRGEANSNFKKIVKLKHIKYDRLDTF